MIEEKLDKMNARIDNIFERLSRINKTLERNDTSLNINLQKINDLEVYFKRIKTYSFFLIGVLGAVVLVLGILKITQ